MFLDLKNKVALVTGGSQGIGFACAESLAAEGCNIGILARNEKFVSEKCDLINEKYEVKCIKLFGDVSDPKVPEYACKEMLNEFEDFVSSGLNDGELDQIKSRLLAGNIYKFDSVFYQVMQVGMLETKNYNWELLDSYIMDINSITESDLKNVAKKIIINKKYLYSLIEPLS